ncbi:hypothetical protein [Algiphilus sp.]|uniref:hypothetical protein n=1 Tax=Algiphilus sp. TaxID=1872431 RepID=UPI0025B8A43E|nr:hypothetical protein [Algiphilus sp.]MCK5771683.1 hypothetical protein [Algiphilus sp.]
MNRTSTTIAVAASLLLPAALWAQEGPALDTSGGGFSAQSQEQAPEPAASRPQADGAAPAVDTGSSGGGGTSVIGDSESPIGLYIIPWRSSSPTPQMDRPARFVDATEEPVDETQFRRFVEYYDALTRHRAAQQGNAGNTGN